MKIIMQISLHIADATAARDEIHTVRQKLKTSENGTISSKGVLSKSPAETRIFIVSDDGKDKMICLKQNF